MEWLAPSEPLKDGDVINEDLLTDSERAEAGAAGTFVYARTTCSRARAYASLRAQLRALPEFPPSRIEPRRNRALFTHRCASVAFRADLRALVVAASSPKGISIDEGGNSWDRFVGGAVDAAAKAAAPAIAAAAVNQMTGQLPNPFGASSSSSGKIGDGAISPSSSPARSKATPGTPGNPFAKTAAADDPTGNPFANPFTGNIPPSPSAPTQDDTEGNPFMAK